MHTLTAPPCSLHVRNRRFKFQKRRQHFISVHNETLFVAMRVSNPDSFAHASNLSLRLTAMAELRAITRNLILVVCVLLGGCAVADFTPYGGAQQNWPIGSGAFVDNKYAVPVFYGPPNRP